MGRKERSSRRKKLPSEMNDNQLENIMRAPDTERESGDNDDTVDSESMTSASLLKNKKVVVTGVVFSVILLYFVYTWVSGRNKQKVEQEDQAADTATGGKSVRWADEEGGELEQQQREEHEQAEFLRQEARMSAAKEIEFVLSEIDKTRSALAQNEGASKQAKSDMTNMFGDEKAGYDSTLSSMETEQSFDTAFMMKSQLDDKRQGMADLSQNLTQQRDQLMNVGQQLGQRYEQLQSGYQQAYGTTYVPRRAIQAAHQQAQAKAMAQAQAANGPPPGAPPHPASGPMGPPPGFENVPPGLGMAHGVNNQARPPPGPQHVRAQPPHPTPVSA